MLLAISTLLGLIGISMALRYQPVVERWVGGPEGTTEQAARLRVVVAVVTAAGVLPLLAFAAYLWRLGANVVKGRRFPPAQVAVVQPTRILEGVAAVRRGRIIQGLAIALAIASAGFVLLWWRVSVLLGQVPD